MALEVHKHETIRQLERRFDSIQVLPGAEF